VSCSPSAHLELVKIAEKQKIGLIMIKFRILTAILLLLMLQACSQQQVVGSTVAVAKLPFKAAGAVAGTAGGVVGGTVGGLVGGSTGRRYGSMAGQSAARKAVP
jgi:hypothetical protein